MSDNVQTSMGMGMGGLNHCLICQVEVFKCNFNNSKLCQKFVTLASRYYNIEFPQNLPNLHKTLKIHQLRAERDSAQLISCDNCFQKLNSFCEIYEEVSFLQIHLDASARKITDLIKNSNNRNNATIDSGISDCFRNQFYSKVAQHFPHVKLRRLEIDDVSTVESDPLYIPLENENSGSEDESYSIQMDHNYSRNSVLPPSPTQPGTGPVAHQAKVDQETKTSNEVSPRFQNLAVESPSINGAGYAVEIFKSLPQGTLLVVPGTAEPERGHKCRFCPKTFTSPALKHKHENTHLQPYQCRFCNRKFSLRATLVVHERTHTGIKPFKCSVCAETFREKRTCRNHVWRDHKGNAEVIKDSKEEQERNLEETKIERNSAQMKPNPNFYDPQNPFKCPICLKNFATRNSLTAHQKVHWKRFNCDICGSLFPTKYDLERHQRTHTGERPYLCPICFRTFSQYYTCRIHQRDVHKIPNAVVVNTKASGVKVVSANVLPLPMENQTVAPGNQSEHQIQGTDTMQCTNSDGANFILLETRQEPEMNLEESEVEIVDTKPVDPLGDV